MHSQSLHWHATPQVYSMTNIRVSNHSQVSCIRTQYFDECLLCKNKPFILVDCLGYPNDDSISVSRPNPLNFHTTCDAKGMCESLLQCQKVSHEESGHASV